MDKEILFREVGGTNLFEFHTIMIIFGNSKFDAKNKILYRKIFD